MQALTWGLGAAIIEMNFIMSSFVILESTS